MKKKILKEVFNKWYELVKKEYNGANFDNLSLLTVEDHFYRIYAQVRDYLLEPIIKIYNPKIDICVPKKKENPYGLELMSTINEENSVFLRECQSNNHYLSFSSSVWFS
jgi:hypothetical protein